MLSFASLPLFARNPQPKFSIPLDPLAVQSSADHYVSSQPFTTVNFVDDQHLLVTYTVHRLMKRLPDEPPDDDDRTVEAVLLEIPSGKALATTEWRLHDRSRYLWEMGHGHFLLRVRNTFTTFAPLANLKHGHAFEEKPFFKVTQRRVAVIQFSPDADFLTVETEPLPTPEPEPLHASPMAAFNAAVAGSSQTPQLHPRLDGPPNVQIMFYRLSPDSQDTGRIVPRLAGAATTRYPVLLPVNGTSFISALSQGPQTWAFDVNTYAGKVYQLPLFDSTCHPFSAFVSKAEFVVFGCRGGSDPRRFAAFNLLGAEMWEKSFYETYLRPTFAFATAAGRFAISRLIVDPNLAGLRDIAASQIRGQTVDVFQTANGNQLLHLDCVPIETAGQNFSISPDGMTLALRNNGAIDFYAMPALTNKEQADVKLALASAPEEAEVPVRLSTTHSDSEAATRSTEPVPQTPAASHPTPPQPAAVQPTPKDEAQSTPVPTPPPAEQSAPAPTSAEGDDPPAGTHRKPPTLYNAPGDPPPSERNSNQPQ